MRRWLRRIALAFAVLLGAIALTPLALYLHFVPEWIEEAEPADPASYPRAALELAARDAGCEGIPTFEPVNIYSYWSRALARDCEVSIASFAAKRAMAASPEGRSQLHFIATSLSTTI